MSWALSWLAIKDTAPASIQQALGLRATGATGDYATIRRGETRLLGRSLNSNWYVLVSRDCAHPMIADATLGTLTQGRDAVWCAIEEHVNFAAAARWTDGAAVWKVQHDGDKDERDLTTSGALPEDFPEIVARVTAESDQAGNEQVDFFFDIPLILAKNHVGFRHDEFDARPPGNAFEWLEPSGHGLLTARKPWWRFW